MARSPLEDHQPHAADTDNTIALWRLDEALATDSAVDAGPNARTLVDTGSPPVATSLFNNLFGTGARTFDGSTRYFLQAAHADDQANFQFAWSRDPHIGYTIEAWLVAASTGTDRCAVDYSAAGETQAANTQACLLIDNTGHLKMFWENGAGVNVTATSANAAITNGTTYHVAVVVDSDPLNFDKYRVTFYVNGELDDWIDNLSPPDGGTTALWCLGRRSDTAGSYFSGTLDDVRVSSFAATPSGVRASYARGVRDFSESTLANLAFTEHHVRVYLQDTWPSRLERDDGTTPEAGDWVDMTKAFGWNWLVSASVDNQADSSVATAEVKLCGRIGEFNLAPFQHTASFGGVKNFETPWNSGAADASKNFIHEMMPIRIEVATVPWGTGRTGALPYFRPVFEGFVKTPNFSEDGRMITLLCGDRGMALQDVWVEPDENGLDRAYGNSAGTPVIAELQAIIDENDPALFLPISVDDTGGGGTLLITFFATTSGPGQGRPHLLSDGDKLKLSGTAARDGVYTVASTTSTTITTVEVGAAGAADTSAQVDLLPVLSYLGGKPTLWAETDPAWNVREWATPSTQNVFTAVEDPMGQIAWRVGMRWDDHRQAFRFAAWRPSTFDISENLVRARLVRYGDVAIDGLWARDVVVGEYEDAGTTGNLGERERRLVCTTNPAAAKAIGRRYARVGVGSLSNVNASGEAQELTDNIADDLDQANADTSFEALFDPYTESGDYFFVQGEQGEGTAAVARWVMPLLVAESQAWGCQGVTHTFTGGSARTVLHGRASSGASRIERHFDMIQANGWVGGKGTLAPLTPAAPGCTGITGGGAIRGAFITWVFPVNDLNRMWDLMQVHISTTTGFTPSSSTIKKTERGHNAVVMGLVASTTYYVKLIAMDRAGNKSAASSQTSFATPA